MIRTFAFIACVALMLICILACDSDTDSVTPPGDTPSWILTTSPRNGNSGVHAETDIWVAFSSEIEPASVNTSTFHLNGHAVPCSVRCDGLTAKLYPLSPLTLGTQYTAALTSAIMDTNGNTMQTGYEWSFRTQGDTLWDTLWDTLVVPSGFNLSISHHADVYQGHYTDVTISALNDSHEFVIGGFDFLIAYNASGLTFMGTELGAYVDSCWEYFTYRYGWDGNCEGDCPSGLLRVVGIADINNGPNHPSSSCTDIPHGTRAELVKMKFYVTNDRDYDCLYLPIRFFWRDCGDNVLSNLGGDTLWASNKVFDFVPEMGGYTEITGTIQYGGHWWLGDCQNPDPWGAKLISSMNFANGGVNIACSGHWIPRGDLNLNNIAHEIADAVLYTNFFIYGLNAFDINPEGQVAASDVNNDGWTLTIADLTYLIRVVVGDALPFPKLTPFANTVTVTMTDGVITSESIADIGSMLFVFDSSGEAELLADGMKMLSDVVDGKLRVLVWSDNTNRIPSGNNEIVRIDGDISLNEIHASDYNGNMMMTLLGK